MQLLHVGSKSCANQRISAVLAWGSYVSGVLLLVSHMDGLSVTNPLLEVEGSTITGICSHC